MNPGNAHIHPANQLTRLIRLFDGEEKKRHADRAEARARKLVFRKLTALSSLSLSLPFFYVTIPCTRVYVWAVASLVHPDCQSSVAFFRLKIINVIDRAAVINPLSIFFYPRDYTPCVLDPSPTTRRSLARSFGGKKKREKREGKKKGIERDAEIGRPAVVEFVLPRNHNLFFRLEPGWP